MPRVNPRCNQEQMQSLIMQANVHHLVCLMASHRQRARRTYGAGSGTLGETRAPALLPDGHDGTLKMDVKSPVCRTGK